MHYHNNIFLIQSTFSTQQHTNILLCKVALELGGLNIVNGHFIIVSCRHVISIRLYYFLWIIICFLFNHSTIWISNVI